MSLRQAAEMALEALGETMGVWGGTCAWHNDVEKAITTLKEALAAPEQEPSEVQCPVCGYYCLGNGGKGCIDKPSMMQSLVIHPEPVPVGWQLVNLKMTPEQRQLMLRADEFTVDEMWIMLLAAAPKPEELK